MWIKKNAQELSDNSNKFKINKLLYSVILLFFFVLIFFISKFFGKGYKGQVAPYEPLSWHETISQIPIYICLAIILTLCVYYVERNKDKMHKQTVICDKCFAVSKDSGNNKCDCGGELINIDLMKWIVD
jgi:hypothetical protein